MIQRWLFVSLLTCAWLSNLCYKLYQGIFYDPNWIRLSMSFALLHESGPYTAPHEGVVLPAMYGPVSFLVYAPAAWFSMPETVAISATLIASMLFFLPVLGLLLCASAQHSRQAWYLFCFFTFIVMLSSPLRAAAFHVHADAPALGFALLAATALWLYKKTPRSSYLWACALAAVLSVWAKQVAFPILLALPLYAWFHLGPNAFRDLFVRLVVFGLGSWLLFSSLFGWDKLYYQLVWIPTHQPWNDNGFGIAIWKLIREGLLLTLFGLPILRHVFRRGNLMLCLSLFLIPLALMSKTKLGGSNNTLSFPLYFYLIALMLAWLQAPQVYLKRLLPILAGLLLFFVPLTTVRWFQPNQPVNYARAAYEHLLANPGQTYFPRLTVVHWLAEQELYHDSMGLRDRIWANATIAEAHFERHIPRNMQRIAFRKGGADEMDCMQAYIDRYNKRSTDTPDLHDFIVYTQRDESHLEVAI